MNAIHLHMYVSTIIFDLCLILINTFITFITFKYFYCMHGPCVWFSYLRVECVHKSVYCIYGDSVWTVCVWLVCVDYAYVC